MKYLGYSLLFIGIIGFILIVFIFPLTIYCVDDYVRLDLIPTWLKVLSLVSILISFIGLSIIKIKQLVD